MASGGDPWKISGEERAKHDAQFFALKPVNGFVTGAQARDFFMQSGLATQILGQIWTLADMNGDGKMDKLEFSVAMHLIKKKLQGYELPKVLPASLKAAPSPVIGSFGMQAGPMSMGQPVVMGIAPAMNPPMGMPMSVPGMMPQASLGTATMTTGSVGMPLMANGIAPAQGMQGMGMPVPQAQPTGGVGAGWTMPHASKLKYTQLFNTHDRNKRGFLTGVEARGILMQSGLPQPVLAQIWMLSDVDNDGKLTCEEFCIAMHLSDMGRVGRALPPKLPPELMPSKARAGSFGPPPGTPGLAGAIPASAAVPPPQAAPQQKDSFGDLLGGFGMAKPPQAPGAAPAPEEPVEDPGPATFEDKRKENFDKGQAELERRRALLQEQMKAEENARLEKERREAEKREKIRLEQEARRQEELQRQMEKQRKLEMERDEQRRKMMEQREQARRDLERQRQMEWERQRKEQLMAEKQREYEQLTTLKAQSSDLKGQLESLDGKKSELALKIQQVRNGVTDLTSSIESMRVQRDTTMADIERSEQEMGELTQKLSRLNGEKEQLQTQLQTQQNTPLSDAHRTVMHSVELKKSNMQKLRRELEQLEQDTETKLVDIDNSNVQLKSLQSLVDQLQREIPALQKKQQEAKALQQQQQQMEAAAAEKQAKERQRHHDHLKKEIGDRKKEEAESKAKASAAVNGNSGKQGSWFDFNSSSGGAGAGSKGTGMDGDAWGSAFGSVTSATTTTGGGTGDVWGSSDPFASSQPQSSAGVKKNRYKALFPFEARSEDELNINTGDDIWVWDVPSEAGMEEWYKGETKNGSVGWFPQAYAEPNPEPAPSAFTAQPGASSDVFGSAFQPVQQTSSSSSHASPLPTLPTLPTVAESSSGGGPPVPESSFQPTPGEAQKAPEGLKAQALYQWKARQDNHLSFNKDDVIVVKEQEDMWWMGELGAKVGWFPKAYVKLLEVDKGPAAISSSQTSSPMGTLERNESARASPAPDRREGEFYVAMYSYVSGEPSDLIFNEGDMILVSKKEDDWWTGTLGEKTGIFPASYVKKVEIQTASVSATPDPFGGFFADFSASVFGDEKKAASPSSAKPVAPPRRSRSKRASESEASYLQSGSSGADPGFGMMAVSEGSTAVAPSPQQSENSSKAGGMAFESAAWDSTGGGGGGSAMFDFSFGSDPFPPQASGEMQSQPEFPDIFSAEVDRALSSSDILDVKTDGNRTESIQTATSDSLFNLDFGSFMSTDPGPKAPDVQLAALTPDSPVAATFYIGESTMSASSSAAELTALEMGARATGYNEDLKADPIPGLFGGGGVSSGSWSALDPLETAGKSARLVSADGIAEPDLPPPAKPAGVSANVSQEEASAMMMMASSAAGEVQEPGQKSAKKPEIAMVIAPYTATGNGQLSLEPGNLIHVRQKSPRGWWEGELQARGQRKKIGWFPADYVKLLGSSSARSTPDPKVALGAGQASTGGSRSTTPQPQPTAPAPSLPPAAAEKLVALYPYAAQNDDELTFEKDAVITVLSRDNPDWWQGEVNGQTGLFPSNYVTPLTAEQS